MWPSKIAFVRQQGFTGDPRGEGLFSPLMFQPRVMAGVMTIGVLLQSPSLFLALGLVLAWGALVPARNVFELVYNRLIARPRGLQPVPVAPPPRRFAQGLAAMLALAAGVALIAGAPRAAWFFEASLAAAIVALVFARFCFGSWLYGLLSGRAPAACVPAYARPDGRETRTPAAGGPTAGARVSAANVLSGTSSASSRLR